MIAALETRRGIHHVETAQVFAQGHVRVYDDPSRRTVIRIAGDKERKLVVKMLSDWNVRGSGEAYSVDYLRSHHRRTILTIPGEYSHIRQAHVILGKRRNRTGD